MPKILPCIQDRYYFFKNSDYYDYTAKDDSLEYFSLDIFQYAQQTGGLLLECYNNEFKNCNFIAIVKEHQKKEDSFSLLSFDEYFLDHYTYCKNYDNEQGNGFRNAKFCSIAISERLKEYYNDHPKALECFKKNFVNCDIKELALEGSISEDFLMLREFCAGWDYTNHDMNDL